MSQRHLSRSQELLADARAAQRRAKRGAKALKKRRDEARSYLQEEVRDWADVVDAQLRPYDAAPEPSATPASSCALVPQEPAQPPAVRTMSEARHTFTHIHTHAEVIANRGGVWGEAAESIRNEMSLLSSELSAAREIASEISLLQQQLVHTTVYPVRSAAQRQPWLWSSGRCSKAQLQELQMQERAVDSMLSEIAGRAELLQMVVRCREMGEARLKLEAAMYALSESSATKHCPDVMHSLKKLNALMPWLRPSMNGAGVEDCRDDVSVCTVPL
eukprot:TRINITY_DN2094_c5_g1_i1.p1 TRINITY_DN2094_c5_g1~~TRINITY_DN2094_c5_g1_i1.p1  ORF type:complete len:274 (+),score=53.93 TRINITY_DN2094_c5_g1_i1:136-957(+)